MKFTRLEIPDVILCEPVVFADERGYFTEAFRQDKLEEFLGYKIDFCQAKMMVDHPIGTKAIHARKKGLNHLMKINF